MVLYLKGERAQYLALDLTEFCQYPLTIGTGKIPYEVQCCSSFFQNLKARLPSSSVEAMRCRHPAGSDKLAIESHARTE